MSKSTAYGGSPNNNNGFTSYTGVRVQSSGLGGFPDGNTDLQGRDRIYLEDVQLAYLSGTGDPQVVKGGVASSGGTWFNSGGTFDLSFYKSAAGTTYFGRNTAGTPSPVTNSKDSTTWTGVLCGTLVWSTVPSMPASITPTRTGRNVSVSRGASSDDGGNAIDNYTFQYSDDGGVTWKGTVTQTGATYVFTNLPGGKTYKFRVYANNDRGNSQARVSGNVFVPAGARRWDGSTEIDSQTFVRWDGTQEVAVSTVVRWDGTAEVPVN